MQLETERLGKTIVLTPPEDGTLPEPTKTIVLDGSGGMRYFYNGDKHTESPVS